MGSITDLSVDIWNSLNYGLPSGLYFYLLNSEIPGYTVDDTDILGNCPAIQSVQYAPFLDHREIDLIKIPYDTERFGDVDKIRPSLSSIPNVYRIISDLYEGKKIGEATRYKVNKNIGGEAHYKNESRLYNYPYSFAMVTDHLNPPMEIKYHLCEEVGNKINIFVKSTISDRCSYGLYVSNYKGDKEGKLEAMVSADAHELPSSSSAYNQWYATSKNQTSQQIKNVVNNSFLTKETNSQMRVPNMIGSLANTNLNPASIIGSGANLVGQNIQYNQSNKRTDLDIQQAIQGKLAQTSDLMSTPNTMLSMGSDVYYGLANGYKKVKLYRFGLDHEQLKKLGDYFMMFGYKQNKILYPNIRNRHYFNYIKTVGVNIKSEWIPRNHLEELKEIFNNGVTVWHIDRENVTVGDYSKDNFEI